MIISLVHYDFETRVRVLREFCTAVKMFLDFAAEERETLDNFFENLNGHNKRLTEHSALAKKIIESRNQTDVVTEMLAKLTDATLKYLSFVTIPESTEWHDWVMQMNTNTLLLEDAYDDASSLIES